MCQTIFKALIRPGGGWNLPPPRRTRDNFADFFEIYALRFQRLFSFESCATFAASKNRAHRSEVTQRYVIASAQNFEIFWICVQNIWKMAFCPKNQFPGL